MADKPKRPGGKPPVEHQFKPGQSGNPGGRPKKTKSLRDTLAERLERLIWVTVEGQRKRVPLREALFDKHLANIEAEVFLKFLKWLEGDTPPRTLDERPVSEKDDDDEAILNAAIDREIARREEDGDE